MTREEAIELLPYPEEAKKEILRIQTELDTFREMANKAMTHERNELLKETMQRIAAQAVAKREHQRVVLMAAMLTRLLGVMAICNEKNKCDWDAEAFHTSMKEARELLAAAGYDKT